MVPTGVPSASRRSLLRVTHKVRMRKSGSIWLSVGVAGLTSARPVPQVGAGHGTCEARREWHAVVEPSTFWKRRSLGDDQTVDQARRSHYRRSLLSDRARDRSFEQPLQGLCGLTSTRVWNEICRARLALPSRMCFGTAHRIEDAIMAV